MKYTTPKFDLYIAGKKRKILESVR